MLAAVKLDMNRTLPLINASRDFQFALFEANLVDGRNIILKVEILDAGMSFMPNVYNLAFGPLKPNGSIDDRAHLPHRNYSAIFSTIVFEAYSYLLVYPDRLIGIDGSDNKRAKLYYYFLQRNYDYLNRHFDVIGVKYYVRITRFGKFQYDNPFDFEDISSGFIQIKKNMPMPAHMFNYFILRLKAEK